MEIRAFFLLVLLWFGATPATASSVLQPPDASSPHATMQSFRQYTETLRAAVMDYQRTRTFANMRKMQIAAEKVTRLFDLEPLPPATRDETGREAISLLLDIFNRLPPFDYPSIPGASGADLASLPTQWAVPKTEIVIARTQSGPHAGRYQFTADTLRSLPAFHARIINEPVLRPVRNLNWSKTASEITGPLVPMSLVDNIPEALKTHVLDTPVWKSLASIALLLVLLKIGFSVGRYVLSKTRDTHAVGRLLGQITLPLMFGVLFALWHRINFAQIHFFGDASQLEEFAALGVMYVCAAWAAWLLIYLIVELIIASPRVPDDSYDAHLLRLVARVLSPIAFAAIIVYGATELGIPALGIVAGLGVGGIAVALAAQSTIDNLFGGLSIFADRPFRIGDSIRYGSDAGVVHSIGLRSTRILSEDGNISVVPNGQLARINITNVTAIEQTGVTFIVKIKSDSSGEQVTRCMEALRASAAADPGVSNKKPSVRLVAYEADTIEIDVTVAIGTSRSDEVELVRNRLMIAFEAVLRESGLKIVSVRIAK